MHKNPDSSLLNESKSVHAKVRSPPKKKLHFLVQHDHLSDARLFSIMPSRTGQSTTNYCGRKVLVLVLISSTLHNEATHCACQSREWRLNSACFKDQSIGRQRAWEGGAFLKAHFTTRKKNTTCGTKSSRKAVSLKPCSLEQLKDALT